MLPRDLVRMIIDNKPPGVYFIESFRGVGKTRTIIDVVKQLPNKVELFKGKKSPNLYKYHLIITPFPNNYKDAAQDYDINFDRLNVFNWAERVDLDESFMRLRGYNQAKVVFIDDVFIEDLVVWGKIKFLRQYFDKVIIFYTTNLMITVQNELIRRFGIDRVEELCRQTSFTPYSRI